LYYLSGDYHPDNLNTDSLPRHHFHVATDDSESDALSIQYDDGDINRVLGGEAALSPASYEFENKPTHSKRTEKLKNIQLIRSFTTKNHFRRDIEGTTFSSKTVISKNWRKMFLSHLFLPLLSGTTGRGSL
jgi:hypothetical protein